MQYVEAPLWMILVKSNELQSLGRRFWTCNGRPRCPRVGIIEEFDDLHTVYNGTSSCWPKERVHICRGCLVTFEKGSTSVCAFWRQQVLGVDD